MNKDKQIEDMAKALCWDGADCNRCADLLPCDKKFYAKRAVERGYRKSAEVAREIFEEIEKFMSPYRYPILADIKNKYTEGEG